MYMMKLMSKETITSELYYINVSEKVREKILNLYELYKENTADNLKNISELAEEILRELFNPFGAYKETMIPYTFFQSSLGKIIIAIMNNNLEKVYTIQDLIEISKTEDRPNGYSKQYIGQEIKRNSLIATFVNGRWEITEDELNRYLKLKGLDRK